jgi:uncharacterized membrane protein
MRTSGLKRYAARRDERQSSERNAPNTSLLEKGRYQDQQRDCVSGLSTLQAPERPVGSPAMTFSEAMEHVAQLFEAIGALVLLVGLLFCFTLAIRAFRRSGDGRRAYQVLRESFGGVILLGIEILVAADLVRTVAVATTLENVVILGLIVLIRTVLSFSLEIEIEGVAPWRRAMVGGAGRIREAAAKAETEGVGPA